MNKIYYAQINVEQHVGYRKYLDNPNAHKGMLWHLFDHYHFPENSGGWVFRAEKNETTKEFSFFVMSKYEPNPDALKDDGILVEVHSISDDIFAKGGRFVFRTRVNAVKKSELSGKRVPLDVEMIPDWTANRFAGAAKCRCIVESVGHQKSFKGHQKITHSFANIKGGLEVTDHAAFVDILANGIGHAKRYGFGLIALNRCN